MPVYVNNRYYSQPRTIRSFGMSGQQAGILYDLGGGKWVRV